MPGNIEIIWETSGDEAGKYDYALHELLGVGIVNGKYRK
jgi:hypothetical protein